MHKCHVYSFHYAYTAFITLSSNRTHAQAYEEHDDERISDAAKGCLLSLGRLQDAQAQQAAEASSAAATTEELLQQAAAAGPPGGAPGAPTYLFDVFLSHKRTDAKDFARALYNLLITRGYRVFLDFEVGDAR